MRKKVTYTIVVFMLICIITLGFFAVPVGFTLCSLIGLAYGWRFQDKTYLKYSTLGLLIGLASDVYTILLIYSM